MNNKKRKFAKIFVMVATLILASIVVYGLRINWTPTSIERIPRVQCSDGIDNDGDGHFDFQPNWQGINDDGDSECTDIFDNDESPRDFCNDDETGINYFIFGTVSGEDDNAPFTQPDECVSAARLREYWCGISATNDYDYFFSEYDCQANATSGLIGQCLGGRCV